MKRTISGFVLALMLIFGATASVQAAPKPGNSVSAQEGIAPFAKVTARGATIWAGPGRSFWSLGLLRRAQIVPLLGVTADNMWYLAHTDFGDGYLAAVDISVGGDTTAPVVTVPAFARVLAGRLAIHTSAGFEAQTVSIIGKNSLVYVLGTTPDGGWTKVRYRFGEGWVDSNFLDTAPNTVKAIVGNPRVVVNAGTLNIRSGPSILFKVIGSVPGGTEMQIVGKSRNGVWLQVKSPFGLGWVNIIHTITFDYHGNAPVTEP